MKKTYPKVRNAYDRERYMQPTTGVSLTEQSHAATMDMKLIMERFTQTGQLPPGGSRGKPIYQEVPDQDEDFHKMHNTIANLKSDYENLPSEIQKNYASPEDFVDAFKDPLRHTELQRDGILTPYPETPLATPPASTEQREGDVVSSEASKSEE